MRFTYSQRLNTQLMVDGHMLRKKKGPEWRGGEGRVGGRCGEGGCSYTLTTLGGRIVQEGAHSHPPHPERYARAHARCLTTPLLSFPPPSSTSLSPVLLPSSPGS